MGTSRFKYLCRICLYENGTISIFNTTKENISIAQKFSSIFSVQIEDRVEYPRDICETCYYKLNDAVYLIEKYKESCKVLENDAENINIKIEYDNTNDNFDLPFDYESTPECKYELAIETESNEIKDVATLVQEKHITGLIIKKLCNSNSKSASSHSKTPSINSESTKGKSKGNKIKVEPDLKRKPDECVKKEKRQTNKTNMSKRNQKVPMKTAKAEAAKLPHNLRISSALLEGEFNFDGEQWCVKKCKQPITNNEFIKKSKSDSKNLKKDNKGNDNRLLTNVLCEVCGETFQKDAIAKHFKRHRIEEFKCNICSRVLSDKSGLKRHISNVHATVKSFKCTLCSSAFGTENSLRSHIRCMHTNKPKIVRKKQCPHCDRQVASNKSLQVHIRAAHTGERPAVCTVCNAQFGDDDYLAIHMRLHTGETPHKCPICSKGFAQLCNMKSHIKYNHRISQLDNETRMRIDQKYIKLMKP